MTVRMKHIQDSGKDYEPLLLKAAGLKNFNKVLGAGAMGTAYLSDKKTVMKITNDGDEVAATSKLIGKKNKYVYQIFGVYSFKKNPGIYAIHQKYYPKSISSDVLSLINMNMSRRDYIEWLRQEWKSGISGAKKELEVVKDFGFSFIEDYLETLVKKKTNPKFLIKYWKEVRKKPGVAKYVPQAINAFSFLLSNGIDWGDMHQGNVRMDGSNMVIIDLGVSSVKGKGKIAVIEGMLYELGY